MEIKKIQLKTILVNTQDIEKNHPELIPAILSYISKKKKSKKRKPRKSKKTVGDLIDEIIASLE